MPALQRSSQQLDLVPPMEDLFRDYSQYVEECMMFDDSEIAHFEEWAFNHHDIPKEITSQWLYQVAV